MSEKDGSGGNPQEGAPPPARMTEEMTAAPKPPRAVPATVIDGPAAAPASLGPSSPGPTQVDAADPWDGHSPELQPRSTGTNTAVDAAPSEPARVTPPPPTAPDPRPPVAEAAPAMVVGDALPPTVGQSAQSAAAAHATVGQSAQSAAAAHATVGQSTNASGQAPQQVARGTEVSNVAPPAAQDAGFQAGRFPANPAAQAPGIAPAAFAAPAYGPPRVRGGSGMGPSALLIIGGLFLAVLLFVGAIGAVVALRTESTSESPPLVAPTPTVQTQPAQTPRTTTPIEPASDPVSAATAAKPKAQPSTKPTSTDTSGSAGSGSTTSGEKKPEGAEPTTTTGETKPSGETSGESKPQGEQPTTTTGDTSGQGAGSAGQSGQSGQAGASGNTRRSKLTPPKSQPFSPETTPQY